MWDPEGVVILSGSGGTTLAEEIAGIIGLPASSCVSASSRVRGECQIRLGTNVRGRNVFVVQSTGHPVNDHVIELALILSACKRASAARVHAIVPYLACNALNEEPTHLNMACMMRRAPPAKLA